MKLSAQDKSPCYAHPKKGINKRSEANLVLYKEFIEGVSQNYFLSSKRHSLVVSCVFSRNCFILVQLSGLLLAFGARDGMLQPNSFGHGKNGLGDRIDPLNHKKNHFYCGKHPLNESIDPFRHGIDHFYDGKDSFNERKDHFCHGNHFFWREKDRSEGEKELFWSRIDLLNERKDFLWEELIDSVAEMILFVTRWVLRTTKWILSVTQGMG